MNRGLKTPTEAKIRDMAERLHAQLCVPEKHPFDENNCGRFNHYMNLSANLLNKYSAMMITGFLKRHRCAKRSMALVERIIEENMAAS